MIGVSIVNGKMLEIVKGAYPYQRTQADFENDDEYQAYLSNCGFLSESRLNSLRQNAINAGYNEADITVEWVTEEAYAALVISSTTLADCIAAKQAEVDILREAKIADGVPYTFPDNVVGVIQTRDSVDIRNIETNIMSATIAVMNNMLDLPMVFRDEANIIHEMTPAQMITMGTAAVQRGQNIYKNSWAHKDAIKLLTTKEEIEAYDITTGWPA